MGIKQGESSDEIHRKKKSVSKVKPKRCQMFKERK